MSALPAYFHQGQRWVSESEPELGLGSVLKVNDRTVTITFKASDATRQYAVNNAPLRRVRFQGGATIRNLKDLSIVVQSVLDRSGLIFYRCGGREIWEDDLHVQVTFHKDNERH